jgi:hypothetical protein
MYRVSSTGTKALVAGVSAAAPPPNDSHWDAMPGLPCRTAAQSGEINGFAEARAPLQAYFFGAAGGDPGLIVAGSTLTVAGFCPSENFVVPDRPVEVGLLDLLSAISQSLTS